MVDISKNSPNVTSGDPKDYPNWQSDRETNTPLAPYSTGKTNHFTADPQGRPNQDLKPRRQSFYSVKKAGSKHMDNKSGTCSHPDICPKQDFKEQIKHDVLSLESPPPRDLKTRKN